MELGSVSLEINDLPDRVLHLIIVQVVADRRLNDPDCPNFAAAYRPIASVCKRWKYILDLFGAQDVKKLVHSKDPCTRYLQLDSKTRKLTMINAPKMLIEHPWSVQTINNQFFFLYTETPPDIPKVHVCDMACLGDKLAFTNSRLLIRSAPDGVYAAHNLLACQMSSTLYITDYITVYRCKPDGTFLGAWSLPFPGMERSIITVKGDILIFVQEEKTLYICYASPRGLRYVIINKQASWWKITSAAVDNAQNIVIVYCPQEYPEFRIARLHMPMQLTAGDNFAQKLENYSGSLQLGPVIIANEITIDECFRCSIHSIDSYGCILMSAARKVIYIIVNDLKGEMRIATQLLIEDAGSVESFNESMGLLFRRSFYEPQILTAHRLI